jgi:ubiquinone/menaquinone biosynthesis C-methylase UbiE
MNVANFYNESCRNFGKEPWRAACWADEEDQYARFVMMGGIIDWAMPCSILDVGCAQGDFYQFIRSRSKTVEYTGIDISSEMIKSARERFPDGCFIQGDFFEEELPKFDYVIGMGAFSLKVEWQDDYIRKAIRRMWNISRRGICFTLCSDRGEQNGKYKEMYYYSPSNILSECLEHTSRVILNHASHPVELLVFMYAEDK